MNTSPITYNEVLDLAQQLDPKEQLRLLNTLVKLVRTKNRVHQSILELQGLGKEIWQGIDAQAYVDRERDAWSG